jgi:hypothetical protein
MCWYCPIHKEEIIWIGELVGDVVGQCVTSNKFERRERSDHFVIVTYVFDAESIMKDIAVRL